jgi:hypothetical protein
MQDIRRHLLRYSDAKCHLWNAYFVDSVTDLKECEPLETFKAIDKQLFIALVCVPLSLKLSASYVMGAEPIKQILVLPKQYIREVPVILREPNTGGGALWTKTDTLSASELSFAFIELFQWNSYDFLNLPLVRCMVGNCGSHPQYLGREALIENHIVDFFLT